MLRNTDRQQIREKDFVSYLVMTKIMVSSLTSKTLWVKGHSMRIRGLGQNVRGWSLSWGKRQADDIHKGKKTNYM